MAEVKQTIVQGTPIVWKASGGDYLLTCTSVGAGAGRQGAKGDLATNSPTAGEFAPEYNMMFQTKWATAPTVGKPLRLLVAFSPDNTNFPGEVGASDAAFNTSAYLLQMVELRPLYAENDTNAQVYVGIMKPLARYVVPVIRNDSDQALSSTAGDHILTFTPLYPAYN